MAELRRWTRPRYYIGEKWPEFFVFLGRNRDSDHLDNSNFEIALEMLGGESETVQVVSENHWAYGWVEWIAIHESDTEALAKAAKIVDKLDNYPVLDEEDFSRREYEEACETWERASLSERVEECGRARCSIFAARRDELPHDGAFTPFTNY